MVLLSVSMSNEKNDMVVDDKTMASGPSIRVLTERLLKTSAVKTQSLVSNGFTPSPSTTSAQPRVAKATAHVCPASVCGDKLAAEQGRWREVDKKLGSLCLQLKRRQLGMVHEHSKNYLRAKKAQSDGGREADVPRQLAARLNSLEQLTDEEATESSSGEEVERDELSQSRGRYRRLTARFRWEQHQASLRSRWAIIRARIAEIERKIQAAPVPAPLKPADGSKDPEEHAATHQTLNNMPLCESMLGSSLWAKLCTDEICTAARTRPYTRRKRVKLLWQQTTTEEFASQVVVASPVRSLNGTADMAYHADLSTISDLASSLFIDDAFHSVSREHNVFSTVRGNRHKGALSLPIKGKGFKGRGAPSTPEMASPSSVTSPSEDRRGSARRRNHSLASPLTSPPGSRPSTPIFRRKKQSSEYSIDNFVVPDVPFTPRLEKLEYKEIATPSWREVPLESVATGSNAYSLEEDISDEATISRHDRCEEKEKRRFINFLTGGRKRRANSGNATPNLSTPADSPTNGGTNIVPLAAKKKRTVSTSQVNLSSPGDVPENFILPWPTRKFPLQELDMKELNNPPPPPPVSEVTVPRTVAAAWGLTSPLTPSPTTPKSGEILSRTQHLSPEWVVNQAMEASDQEAIKCGSNLPHLVLKLTKRN